MNRYAKPPTTIHAIHRILTTAMRITPASRTEIEGIGNKLARRGRLAYYQAETPGLLARQGRLAYYQAGTPGLLARQGRLAYYLPSVV